MEASRWGCRASELLGLVPGSYEAYCLDQAIGYVGAFLQNELEKVSSKPSKESRRVEQARQKVLDKYLGKDSSVQKFADPALLFG